MRRAAGWWVLVGACASMDEPDAPAQQEVDGAPDVVALRGDPAGDGLRVGAAAASIVPRCFEAFEDLDGNHAWDPGAEPVLDCGCDRVCPDDAGWTGADEGEGDDAFEASWLAGFINSRPAVDVRGADRGLRGEGDGLEARAIVLDQGGLRVGLVTLDAIGFMRDDVLAMRAAVEAADLGVDHLVVHSSHTHSAPDVMGLYGRSLISGGYDPDYAAQVVDTVVEVVGEASAAAVPATMSWGVVDSTDAFDNGVANLIRDSRDPFIVDPRVGAVRFADADDHTIATLVHFANHPETIGSRNNLITSGFVHALRDTVSDGSRWDGADDRPGIGGTTLFLNGTVGGMMTSLGATVVDPTGAAWTETSWEKTDAVGQLLGELALDALSAPTPAPEPALAVAGQTVVLPVDNVGFQSMFALGVFDHRSVIVDDPDAAIGPDNGGRLETEVDLLTLGPLTILSFPGEVLPGCVIGGYDGRWTPPGVPLIDPGNPAPPDLSAAPAGPYLADRLGDGPKWVVSLGNDEIGYLIPPYDFVVGSVPYLSEAEGDHYEETNSLGPESWPLLEGVAEGLLDWAEGG